MLGASIPRSRMDSARSASGDPLQRAGIQKEVRQILAALPSDVQAELNAGTIDVHDPAFLDGLADHISRLAVARPSEGRKWLGKLSRLKTLIRRSLREEDPEIRTATTIRSELPHVGRNEPCPCGSGRKYKQCCMRA